MSSYLLDTHTIAIWFFNGDDALSETAQRIILDPSNRIYLSIVSAWELAIKIGLEKLAFDGRAEGFIRLAEANGFAIIHIETHLLLPLKRYHGCTATLLTDCLLRLLLRNS